MFSTILIRLLQNLEHHLDLGKLFKKTQYLQGLLWTLWILFLKSDINFVWDFYKNLS